MKSVAWNQEGNSRPRRRDVSDLLTLQPPHSEAELEDALSTPAPGTIEAAAGLDGDLLVLGAGGKMGPSFARLARRSIDAAGVPHRVICVSRFGSGDLAQRLQGDGIETISADLLDPAQLRTLPECPNVVYLAGFKFGASGAPHFTWAMNCYLPAIVADRFSAARIVALSTGNVYPLVPVESGGATEETPPAPIGEYAQSCLGRERMFEYMAQARGARSVLIRLNYATDLRYGVLLDIAQRVASGEPVDVTMGWLNTIWQGDANGVVLRAFELCSSPPDVLNVTGPELISIRAAATRFAELLDRPVAFTGSEADSAFLSNAARCHSLFGQPSVPADTLITWTAEWVRANQPTLGKPTHFETRDGRY
jgi:nucleoside-diphosphate-sugar epimerase